MKKKDPNLDKKLEAELPGIFNWALEGWRRVRERGHILHPKSVMDVVKAHRESSDLFQEFYDTHFVERNGAKVRLKQAFANWQLFCRDLNVPNYQITLHDYREELVKRGLVVRKSTGNASYIFGVELVTQVPLVENEEPLFV